MSDEPIRINARVIPRAGRLQRLREIKKRTDIARLYRPLKAPNEIIPFDSPFIHYGYGVKMSVKMDGNRMMAIDGRLYTSSMKEPRNEVLKTMLQPLCDMSKELNAVFDFEVWSPTATHHAQLAGWINSYDQNPPTDDVAAYIFDMVPIRAFRAANDVRSIKDEGAISFGIRQVMLHNVNPATLPHVKIVAQHEVHSPAEAETFFQACLETGQEGAMLRHSAVWQAPNGTIRGGLWKHGRATIYECNIFKFKKFNTVDGVITEVLQRRALKDDLEREVLPSGHLKRPLEKDAFVLTECVGGFVVNVTHEGRTFSTEVSFGPGWSIEDRHILWAERANLIGKHIEIEFIDHGAKADGKLRGGRLIRFREDLD